MTLSEMFAAAGLTAEDARRWAAWHEHHARTLEDRAAEDASRGYAGEASQNAVEAAGKHRAFAAALRALHGDAA